jgi:hypothetical protein
LQIEHSDPDTLEFVDSAAMSFMALTINRLNEALVANGVGDVEVRKNVCASFLFEFAYHHDAGWLVHDNRKLYPIVSFAERAPLREGENLGAISRLHVPTDASSWHEYAHGVVSQFFDDDQEQVAQIKFGSYDLD